MTMNFLSRGMSTLRRQERGNRQRSRAMAPPSEVIGMWGAIGIISIMLLLLALVMPASFRIVLSAAGLAGLLAIRLTARPHRWISRVQQSPDGSAVLRIE